MSDDILLVAIARNGGEELRLTPSGFQGHSFFNQHIFSKVSGRCAPVKSSLRRPGKGAGVSKWLFCISFRPWVFDSFPGLAGPAAKHCF